MIVKVTYGSEEQSYFLDDSIDVRHMLIDYVDDYITNGCDEYDDLYKYVKNVIFSKFRKCICDVTHYTLIVGVIACTLIDERTEQLYRIYFSSLSGNCVDKFMTYKMGNDIWTLDYFMRNINSRRFTREIEKDYHSSALFEKDFYALTRMKEAAQSIIENINKFQENITLVDYTA